MSNVPYDPGAATGDIPGTGDATPYPYGAVAYTDGSGNGSIVTSVNGLPIAIVGTPLVTIAAALPAGTNVIGGVAGDVAAGVTDSGNPVKIGGYASPVVPTAVTAGQRVNAWYGLAGAAITARQTVGNPSDANGNNNFIAVGGPFGQSAIENAAYLFNNVSWDRNRNNYEVTQFASAARTTSQNGADQTNYNARGIVVVLNVSAGGGGSGSLTFKVQGKDTLSGQYYDILTSAAITGASVNAITVYPGVTVAANGAASFPLPRIWRVVIAAGDATSFTYSVAANYIN